MSVDIREQQVAGVAIPYSATADNEFKMNVGETLETRLKLECLDAIPDKKEFIEEDVFKSFVLSDEKLLQVRDLLDEKISMRLNPKTHHGSPLKFYPSFVERVPDGSESGTFLSVDIGGTHSRVLAVTIKNGQIKTDMVRDDLESSCHFWKGTKIFDFIADQLHRLLSNCDLLDTEEPLFLGFTFSFPVKQLALNKAILIQWTKDFHNDDIIGQDVVELLEEAIKRRGNMHIRCCAILNDTIGTLMSGAFRDKGCAIGLICGTGTNGCCLEPIDNVVDYKIMTHTASTSVAIDTRWNNFGCDDSIDFLRSDYDIEIRRNTAGCAMGIEKLMSGMFIGEVVRQVLFRMHSMNIILASWPERWLDVYSLQTETVSELLKVKETEDQNKFLESQGIAMSATDFKIIKLVCQLVVLRAAHLTAACTACLVNRVGRPLVGIAVDGSVYKHIQMFRDILEEKIGHLVKPGVQCYFVPCEDGSGVGAALIAAMVSENNKGI